MLVRPLVDVYLYPSTCPPTRPAGIGCAQPIDKSAQDVKPTIIPCASHWRQPDHVTDGPHWEVVVVVAAVVAAVVAVVVAVVVV